MKSFKLKLSIIIPAYNCAKTIENLMNSIRQQELESYEIIIVNDGSTDETPELLAKASENWPQLKVLTQENGGAPKARNAGLDCAEGEYIYLCDADDLLYPNGLNKLIAEAEKQDHDIVVGNLVSRSADGEEQIYTAVSKAQEKLGNDKYYFCDPIPGTKLFRRDFINNNNIRFDDVKIGQDLNFFLKAVCATEKIGYLNDIIYVYQTSFSGISKTYKLKNLLDIKRSLNGVLSYCRTYGLDSKERMAILECVKINNYLWQLKKKKNVNKDDYQILRKELYQEIDIKKAMSYKHYASMLISRIEYCFSLRLDIILRGI